MTSERRVGIRTTSETAPSPFAYPGGIRPAYAPVELTAAETWILNTGATRAAANIHAMGKANDLDSKRNLATYYEERARREEAAVEAFYQGLTPRPILSISSDSWTIQQNTYGMYTCQIASAINGLRQLGVYDPAVHTEQKFLEELGGRNFAASHEGGMEMEELIPVLQQLSPRTQVRRSNSVLEMLRAGENGAAVMFPFSSGHEALIPPGRRLRRNPQDGELEVQIINSLRGSIHIDFVKVKNLVRSEITLAENPETPDIQENNVLIIERLRQPIQTLRVNTDTRVPIRTINSMPGISTSAVHRSPIKTVEGSPGIRTNDTTRSGIRTVNPTPNIRSRRPL